MNRRPSLLLLVEVFLLQVLATGTLGMYPIRCFQCNYYEFQSTDDANLNTAVQTIENYMGPTLRQCMYDYSTKNSIHRIDTSGIPAVDCSQANLTHYSTLLGVSLDGFKCGKISSTFTLKDMNSGQYGQTLEINGVVRGCIPYQAMSPFGFDKCYDLSDDFNPYVQLYLASFNTLSLKKNIVLNPGVSGYFCMCSHKDNCNSGIALSSSVVVTALMVAGAFLKFLY